MTDRPIIFSAPMVRALLDGRKTQTRRKLRPCFGKKHPIENLAEFDDTYSGRFNDPLSWGYPYAEDGAHMPFGMWPETWGYEAGNFLWVRENWCPANSDDGPVLLTKADCGRRYLSHESWPVDYSKFPAGRSAWSAWAADVESRTTRAWRPSIFMPRWASRLTLKVSAVKIERLQDISEEDAIAEGIGDIAATIDDGKVSETTGETTTQTGRRLRWASRLYAQLWDEINGKGAWDANPWVVAITFSVIKANIDSVLANAPRCEEVRASTNMESAS